MNFLRKCLAFLKRDAIETLSYRTDFFLAAFSILAQTFTFFFISRLVGSEADAFLDQFQGRYFEFVLVGITLMSFQAAALESFAKGVYREISAGTLEAILMTPTGLGSIACAHVLWATLMNTLKFAAWLGAGALFFQADLSRIHPLSTLLTIFLTMLALAGFGLISAGSILVLKRGDPLGFVLNGLSRLTAGVYFPLALLPAPLAGMGQALPLTYSLSAMRKAVLDGASPALIQNECLILAAFSAVLLPAGCLFFGWAVRQMRREGTLTFS